jgi:DNA repair exonuclease SbcCD ATPase subunit
MLPINLIIKNFTCHDYSEINFRNFDSALIIGKINASELYSNGSGKSSIFEAIEFCLFNNVEKSTLDAVIRDDAPSCNVTLDFEINNSIYRISRTRTRKTSDVSLFIRNNKECDNPHELPTNKLYWDNLSCRRASDTEKEIEKLIKVNCKSFRSITHFMQNDFSGLATLTAEKRKAVLREPFNLLIFSKLEKFAKDKAAGLSKKIDINKSIISNFDIGDKEAQITQLLNNKTQLLSTCKVDLDGALEQLNNFKTELSKIEHDFASDQKQKLELVRKLEKLKAEKETIQSSLNAGLSKLKFISDTASQVVAQTNELNTQLQTLNKIDLSKIESCQELLLSNNNQISQLNFENKTLASSLEELKIPFPKEATCRHCRQPLTDEHRAICQNDINKQIAAQTEKISLNKIKLTQLNQHNQEISKQISQIQQTSKQIDLINQQIKSKKQEYAAKKELHKEVADTIKSYKESLSNKEAEFLEVDAEIKKIESVDHSSVIESIKLKKESCQAAQLLVNSYNKQQSALQQEIAVLNSNLTAVKNDIEKCGKLQEQTKVLEKQYSKLPKVIEAFSSTGIPNIIIQSMLDDLQVEANKYLTLIRPDLQLCFIVEKTNSKGEVDDTLNIVYFANGRSREYSQLSGAMKLAVNFSLKLGFSAILQRLLEIDIKFILLDEVDQSLDKASADAFVDIVKMLHVDYKVLIITHNDRLKDKFQHAIVVEQNSFGVSNASLQTAW